MSITNLGKRKHLILRDSDTAGNGDYVDGEWVEAVTKPLEIIANIQPSTMSYKTQMLPTGEREKEAIAIFSNDWLHVVRTGSNPLEADIVLYRGAQWKVVVSRPYGNFGQHCEAIAIKLDDTLVIREEGRMGVIT